MDILMITLSLFGLGCLTVGTGAAVKEAVSNLSDRQDSKPNPIAVRYLKKFFKIYIVVYAILNLLVMLFFVISGQEETMNSIRSTLINCNLLLALLITWGITKYKMKLG
jgi:hypothetical protein